MKQRHPLNEAEVMAQELRAILGPTCQQIEVAGSIRRRLPRVGDIELLCAPGTGGNDQLGAYSPLDQAILGLIERGVLVTGWTDGDAAPSAPGTSTWSTGPLAFR